MLSWPSLARTAPLCSIRLISEALGTKAADAMGQLLRWIPKAGLILLDAPSHLICLRSTPIKGFEPPEFAATLIITVVIRTSRTRLLQRWIRQSLEWPR